MESLQTGTDSIDFPEAWFPPLPDCEPEYQRRVKQGLSVMRSCSVAICGIGRNVASILPLTIKRIERLAKMFRDYRIIIYENDSTDGTQKILRRWSENNIRVTVISEHHCLPHYAQVRESARTFALAFYRERYRKHLTEVFPLVDYVIVVDTDLRGGWSYQGVATSFSYTNWSVIGSNGISFIPKKYAALPTKTVYRQVHFDAWAFRPLGKPDVQHFQAINNMQNERHTSLIPVESCFGGLAVYEADTFQKARYDGFDCEHVPFHQAIKSCNTKGIFMNPSQITIYDMPLPGRILISCSSIIQNGPL